MVASVTSSQSKAAKLSALTLLQPELPSPVKVSLSVSFLFSDIYELPDTDMLHSFDVVLAIEVIEHLFYPNELAKSAKKCLHPGGSLIISTPYHGYLKNLV